MKMLKIIVLMSALALGLGSLAPAEAAMMMHRKAVMMHTMHHRMMHRMMHREMHRRIMRHRAM